MRSTIGRMILCGASALGVLGAGSGLVPCASTAEAAPSTSPFAGSYSGGVPGMSYPYAPVSISISSRGHVSGSWKRTQGSTHGMCGWAPCPTEKWSGSLDGRVTDGGEMTISVDEKHVVTYPPNPFVESSTTTWHLELSAAAVLDASGNLVATDAAGSTFVWYRH